MEPSNKEITVMFADIADSTRLYEIMGDEKAEELVSTTLKQLSNIIRKAQGEVVKTIGDEVMCRFSCADNAITAAREMHEFLANKKAPSSHYKLAIRIGAHHGSIIESDGDIFGDAVNIAARITALARAGKTMITKYTFEQLSDSNRERCSQIMCMTVKGKEQPIDVFDVAWEQSEEITRIVGNHSSNSIGNKLAIQFNGNTIKMSAGTITSIKIGRGNECTLIVQSPQASREHCKIEYNRGKFIFSDHSANGSYIHHNQIELFFHQESVPLLDDGSISLGEPSANNPEFQLNYSIEPADQS